MTKESNEAFKQQEEEELLSRVSDARLQLTSWIPFLGYLTLNLKPRMAREGDHVQTAGISPDGTLVLNYGFCMSLDKQEFCGLLCHEVMHPALLCWQRQQGRKAVLRCADGSHLSAWNLAHDYAINLIIQEMTQNVNVKLPEGGAIDQKYASWSAEEIYNDILQSTPESPWPSQLGDLRADLSEDKGVEGDPTQDKELESKWKVAVVTAAKLHESEQPGSLPASIQKIVSELLDPKVDWQDVLSMWIGSNALLADYTYSRPSRRSESVGEFLPSVHKSGVADLVILWDTSGSMNGREKEILGEVGGIVDDLGLSVRILIIDTEIHADLNDVQGALDVIPSIRGGGGSDFTLGFTKLQEDNFDGVVLAFTDGMIRVPTVKPVHIRECVWVIKEQEEAPASWGQVIRINKDGSAGLE